MDKLGVDVGSAVADLPNLETGNGVGNSWTEIGIARQLWRNVYSQCQDSSIGLKVGEKLQIRAFNVLAPVLSHSPNLVEAVKNALRYQQLLSQSGVFRHTVDGSLILARYHPALSYVPIHYTQVDSVMAAFVNALRMFVSTDIQLNQVNVIGPPREGLFLYESFYQCPIRCSTDQAEIQLNGKFLKAKVVSADEGIYRVNKALAEDRLQRLQDIEQLHSSVAEAISSLHFARAKIGAVASELLLTPRTLQRKLGQSGSSFRAIQEQVILREVIQLLGETNTSISEIGLLLGYSEISAFSRAMKSMTGRSPVELRRIMEADGEAPYLDG